MQTSLSLACTKSNVVAKNAQKKKRAVKIIAGIDNFDKENVKKVVSAANQAGASAIDLCASEEMLTIARQLTDLPLFVSSIVPEELAQAAVIRICKSPRLPSEPHPLKPA